jgi:hypothetical protein
MVVESVTDIPIRGNTIHDTIPIGSDLMIHTELIGVEVVILGLI